MIHCLSFLIFYRDLKLGFPGQLQVEIRIVGFHGGVDLDGWLCQEVPEAWIARPACHFQPSGRKSFTSVTSRQFFRADWNCSTSTISINTRHESPQLETSSRVAHQHQFLSHVGPPNGVAIPNSMTLCSPVCRRAVQRQITSHGETDMDFR